MAAKKRAPAKPKPDPVSPEAMERIRADIKVWVAGKWAEEYGYGPACHCGLRQAKEPCPRHGERDTQR